MTLDAARTLAAARQALTDLFRQAGLDSPDTDARLLIAHALDIGPKAGISETVKAIFEKPIIPISQRIPSIPLKVAAVIETALAKQVELRWANAGAMREALLRAASEF